MPALTPLFLALSLALSPARASSDVTGWEAELARAVAEARQADPAVAAGIDDLPAVTTRAGSLHLVPAEGPYAEILLADRLHRGVDTPEIRLAVASAITARGFEIPVVMAGLVDAEQDPAVKAVLMHGLKRVDGELALPRLEAGLAHADARVRLEAAVVAGSHEEGASLASALIAALDDSDVAVRGRAARALGRHGVTSAWDALRARLVDSDPTVRLQALRALERIDASRLVGLPEVAELAKDADPKVARAAAGLAP